MKKVFAIVKNSFSTLVFCLLFCLESTKLLTLVRLVLSIIPALLTLLTSYMGKILLDLISSSLESEEKRKVFLIYSLLFFGTIILQIILQNASNYVESTHSDILNNKIALKIMQKTTNIDLEYYDSAEYYDQLTVSVRDGQAISSIVWNAISLVSGALRLAAVLAIIIHKNYVYCVVMIFAAIPSAFFSLKMTKETYALSLNQVNQERRKNYLQSITMNKTYATGIRIYHIGQQLIKRYEEIWKSLFSERKKLNRKKAILMAIFSIIPESAVLGMG